MKHRLQLILSFSLLTAAASACDLCGTTLIQHPWDPRRGFTFGASEQFTHMATLQDGGSEIDNVADQRLDSSITQIFLGYHIAPRFGVQVNVPLIRRTFRRASEGGLEHGTVQGLGDVSVSANWLAVSHRTEDFSFQLGLGAGLKFPTGDSARLAEEGAEGHTHAAADAAPQAHVDEAASESEHTRSVRHAGHGHANAAEAATTEAEHTDAAEAADHEHTLPDGIHGHDLALGSGSVDGIFSATMAVRWKRLFFDAEVQYALRGDGDHSYDYADDFLWSGGPGVTLIDRESQSLALQFVCSGETKGEDEFRGNKTEDTAITQVFLGPRVIATWRQNLTAEFGVDIPVHQYNSGVQIVPDYRVRALLSWSF